MKLGDITDERLALVWEQFDHAHKGKPARIVYCADGDGFIEIRETKDGLKLFDQGDYVATVPGTVIDALQFSEDYMVSNGYEGMFEACKEYR